MTGVFAAGRTVNPRTARSRIPGGMTMELSMVLHKKGAVDARHGGFVYLDPVSYRVGAHADVGETDVTWVDEENTAIRVRLRSLPVHVEDLLGALPERDAHRD